jgi:[acyl-carrier-protein] S-malonyltransferase
MIGFVFPGQGAQYPGMGKDLVDNFPVAARVFEEANDALSFDIRDLCFNGSIDDLKLTENTQPAILTTSIAALRVVESETGLTPGCAAGHSLGEYSALVCAGTMSFADAVMSVRKRGRFMQEVVPVGVGAMAAIMGLDDDVIIEICREAEEGEVVSAANFNCPGQLVIAGNVAAVERAMKLATERGAKRALPLPVSAPFHCSLMVPAGERLSTVLTDVTFNDFTIPVFTNVEAMANDQHGRVQELLVKQVSAPVRWTASVQAISDFGVDSIVEIGPGKVLSGLAKRIVKGIKTHNIASPDDLKKLS